MEMKPYDMVFDGDGRQYLDRTISEEQVAGSDL